MNNVNEHKRSLLSVPCWNRFSKIQLINHPRFKDHLSIALLILTDLVSYYLTLFFAHTTRNILSHVLYIPPTMPFTHFISLWWFPLFFIGFIAYEKLYTRRLPFWEETRYMTKAVTMSVGSIFVIVSLGQMFQTISRLTTVFLWLYGLFIFPTVRFFSKRFLSSLGIWRRNILIYGARDVGKDVAKGILHEKFLGYNLVGFLEEEEYKNSDLIKINGSTYKVYKWTKDLFDDLLSKEYVESIIIALPSLPKEEIANLISSLRHYVNNIFVVPDIKGVSLMNADLYYLFMEQLFLIRIKNDLQSWYNQQLKRIFDLTVSTIAMPFFLCILAIVAILIKLDSEGPVFYLQERLGKNRKRFQCIKFRTMYVNSEKIFQKFLEKNPEAAAEWQKYKKLKTSDPRVTRVGRFLRKTSLDELPQIINVWLGTMSLVGPRPYLPNEVHEMREYADMIFNTYPGITGLWQVCGRNNLSFKERVILDAWYVTNWNLWLDISLVFRTVLCVFKRDGAF